MESKLIMVNVGHMDTEMLPFVIDSLMKIGAENAQAFPAITKKGRPAFIFFIDAAKELIEPISDFLMRELGVIGLRVLQVEKHVRFDYAVRKVEILSAILPKIAITVKCIRDRKGEIASVQAEHEEIQDALYTLKERGKRVPFKDLKGLVETVALHQEPINYQGLEIRIIGDN
jgi:uncharacterized protein (DUF111 family)